MENNETRTLGRHRLLTRLAAGVAALAMLAGIGGVGLAAADHASAQSPTSTATVTATGTPGAPVTGSGLSDSGTAWEVPLVVLAIAVLGGAGAIAIAGRKS